MAQLDWLVLAIYAVAVLLVGFVANQKSNTETDYFLAGRQEGWAPVAASTWATKLSALTFIGVPGAAMSGNFAYLQLWFGSFAAAYIVAVVFIPEFYRLRVATVYEYLAQRIGPQTRTAGTIVFIISRCLASAVRLAGCAIAVSVFFSLSVVTAIVLISSLAAIYVLSGGLRAVIWTDVLQLALFLAGAIVSIAFIAANLPGGFQQIIEIGNDANKFKVFDFGFGISDATTFWMGNLFALVLGVATGAADQDIAQRALACPSPRQAKIALITAGGADLISTFLFLSVGAAVFAYYQAMPNDAVSALIAQGRYDHIFPHFIRHELPAGLRGALIAALFAAAMSSLDSALSGLASSAYFDLGLTQNQHRDANNIAGPRILVIVFAIILTLIAISFGSQPSILWFGFKIMGYTYGSMLGLFLLAAFAPTYVDDRTSAASVFASITIVVAATQWGFGMGPAPWPWAVIIGVLTTCGLAIAFSNPQLRPKKRT